MKEILKQIKGQLTSSLTILKKLDNGNAYEAGETIRGTLFIRPLRVNGRIYEWQEFEKEYLEESKFLKSWNSKK